MANTKPGTSLLAQTDEKKKKWGGDIYNYDINGAIKGYDSAFAEYNAEGTTQERKDAINALYGGDITKWDNKNAYTSYMDDLNEVRYIDSLNNAYTASMDAAKDAEQRKTQYVDTRRMLMQKYLPDTLQSQGVANTGYVADSLLKAENNYNQYLLGAINERSKTEQNAMQAYQDSLQTYKQQQANTAYERFMQDQAKKEAEEKEAAAKAEATELKQKTAYSDLLGAIAEGADIDMVVKQAENYGLSTPMIDGLKAYAAVVEEKEVAAKNEAEENRQKEVYATLIGAIAEGADIALVVKQAEIYGLSEQMIEGLKEYAKQPEGQFTFTGGNGGNGGNNISPIVVPQEQLDETKFSLGSAPGYISATNYGGETDNGRDLISTATKNDGFHVSANGNKYLLKTAGTIKSDSALARYVTNLPNGMVFMYDGKLYVKNGNEVQRIKENAKDYKDVLEYFKS